MTSLGQNVMMDAPEGRTIAAEANSGNPHRGDFERMARRRFQNPKPFRRGGWWIIQVRRDVFIDGKLTRKNQWEKLAPATMPERQVLKIASEHLRDLTLLPWRLGRSQVERLKRDHWRRCGGDPAHSTAEGSHREGESRASNQAVQSCEGGRLKRPGVSVGQEGPPDA